MSDVIGASIREVRRRRGMTRDEVAEAAGGAMTAAVVGYLETGRPDAEGHRRREVSVDELVAIARALGVPPLSLAGDSAVELDAGTPACARCAAEQGSVSAALRSDVAGLGPLTGAEATEVAAAEALARSIDAATEDTRHLAGQVRELRAALSALQDRRTPDTPADDEGDMISGLGDPD